MLNRNVETELEETEKEALICSQKGTQQDYASSTVPLVEELVRSLTVVKEQGVISLWTFS